MLVSSNDIFISIQSKYVNVLDFASLILIASIFADVVSLFVTVTARQKFYGTKGSKCEIEYESWCIADIKVQLGH